MRFVKTLKGKMTLATCGTVLVGAAGFLADIQSFFLGKPASSVVVEEIKVKPVALSVVYQELSNSRMAKKHIGTEMEFQITYLGPWNLDGIYFGIDIPDDVVLLNHRDSSYTSFSTPLGSSDLMVPNFAITVPLRLMDDVLKYKSHSQLVVKGLVYTGRKSGRPDYPDNEVVILAANEIRSVE